MREFTTESNRPLPLPSIDLSESQPDADLIRARQALSTRYAIESEFVGVPTLARILGMGETTIYEHIRKGKFFLPHRMMNKTPRVALDDLAAWCCSADATQDAKAREPYRWKPSPMDPDVRLAVDETLRSLSIQPATPRRRRG